MRRAQEEREERRAQEAREQRKAQEERENGVKAQQERREEREVEAQEGHDGEEEMTTQETCVEAKEVNSMYEESDVSNRHMTWWRNAWWVRVDNGPHCGRREAVDERGEQPRGLREKRARPNRSQGEKGRNWSKGQRGDKKATHCGMFQDSDFAGDLEDSKSTSGGTLCIFGCHTFVPISWMCKKQTAVSHSSTESEIISLDTGLRLDGLPALELWDLIVSVLGNISRVSDRSGKLESDEHKHHKSHNKIDVTRDIDLVPSNVQSANGEALLYVFEDNEAVIKMIMKGRSPTMRHVSRTHRVALDWLFDRINLDPKIQIKYIATKNQLADILTKGNFTRDEWNHLLCLFNVSHFSSAVCTAAMAKRAQQGSGEERVTAKSRPIMNLTARTPSFVSSSASSNPGRISYGCQDPGRSVASDDRTGKLVEPARPDYTQEDCGRSWSSQEWKSGAAKHDRSGKPEDIFLENSAKS